MRKSAKTALGGIIASLSLVLMLLSTVIPNLTYVLPAMAGIVLMIMVIEIGRKWALTAYIVIAILSMFILPDKETALVYVGFFGYYPIIKSLLEQKLNKILSLVIKLLIFNISVVGVYCIVIFVFKIPVDGLDIFKQYTIPILLAAANLVFLLFDFSLSRLVMLYLLRFRKYVRRIFK